MKTASLVLCLVASAAALQQRTGAVPVGRAAAKVAAKAPASAGSIANGGAAAPAAVAKSGGVDVSLIAYFFFWYLGNYYYNISNKLALKAAGGAAGFPMTISTLQLGVGAVYAMFLWLAPDSRAFPTTTSKDIAKLLPVAVCNAGAHASSVFALSAGAVSFGQIVKAAEPAFAAVIGTFVYGSKISLAKWLCLIPVIGGVVLASVKELDFAVSALVSASIANVFAAFKGNENAKVMTTPGLKERIGSVGNQFALTTLLSFVLSLPLVYFNEGHKLGQFVTLWKSNPIVRLNVIASGLYFYGYNELATMTIKKTSAVTQSVANTAKRVIVIIAVALVLGEALPVSKLVGSGVCISGVFLYSVIDSLVAKKAAKK
mmetsp:Transcript_7977/g.26112  ORF Transcript_7977/g.26112 Transcript_7977/m.26112 type:complete len:373 (-) Transcript_7977:221-1339(-)